MKTTTIIPGLVLTFFLGLLCARGAEPWEDAAIKGLASMNCGDGKTFAEVAHADAKKGMRTMMLGELKATPGTAATRNTLKDLKVSTVEEIEKLSVDERSEEVV